MTRPNPSFDDIEIRRLLATDSLTELTALLHQAYAKLADMGLRYKATNQPEAVTAQRVAEGECYVAVLKGQLVGTILFKPTALTGGSPWLDCPEVSCLAQFAVHPAMQGSGLGGKFMQIVETRAVETGAMHIALDTAEPATHLVQWYARCGYAFVEYAQWTHTNYRSVIMSKPLDPAHRALETRAAQTNSPALG